MPIFEYTARDGDGNVVKSAIPGANRLAALAALQADGLTVVDLREPAAPAPATVAAAARGSVLTRVPLSERSLFCRQLAVSVNAGLSLREAIETIAEDMEHPRMRQILQRVVGRLHAGHTFSEAISGEPAAFDTIFVALVRVAEEAGSMPETLEQLANALERNDRLARKIRSITAYPMFVAVFFGVVCLILTLFVLPHFQEVFSTFDATLPKLTRVVFRANQLLIANIGWLALCVATAIVAVTAYGRTVAGRIRLDGLRLRIPMVGPWLRKYAIARFSRNLGIMVRGGVPLAGAIESAAATCGNRAIEATLRAVRDRVVNGSDFAGSLQTAGEFPRLLVRMVRVGESSGRLPEVLEKVADTYENQVEGSVMIATALFEPVIICLFGMVVLVLVLAIYMPVFTVASQVR